MFDVFNSWYIKYILLIFLLFLSALQRYQIVTGLVVPTDEECDFQSDSEKEIELSVSIFSVSMLKESQEFLVFDSRGNYMAFVFSYFL